MFKRVIFGLAVVCVALVWMAAPAQSAPTVVNGPCQGKGAFAKGGFTKTAAESGVVTIPNTDDVSWEGSISGPTGDQSYAGSIKVDLPPPFGDLKIDSWKGTTDSVANSGVKHYHIPDYVPGNVEFEVTGSHTQGGVTCAGHVTLKLDGSAFNAFSLGSLVGTALTGVALVFAGKAK